MSRSPELLSSAVAESLSLSVQVNGTPVRLDTPHLRAELAALDVAPDARHVAIAVNDAVIARTNWDEVTLQADDRIEVITAVAGG
jgi:sulfur carrier protein